MSVSKLRPNDETDSNKVSVSSVMPSGNINLEGQTLMVIDDYESNLQAMESLFESQYQVVLFNNAKSALEYAQIETVDLILLDVDMPHMNGHEACAALKSNPVTTNIPIIFVTAAGSVDEEAKGLLLGAVDYIAKPVNLTILWARVRNHMELVYYRKQLEVLSSVDGLTGVANRRQLDSVLQLYFASSIRFGQRMTVMMIDIDDFKPYNDIYGHLQGDECLKEVAKAIQGSCRETDFVGRYGGEEFCVLLPDTDLEGGLTMANKLLQSIRKLNIEHEGASTTNVVTISIGLVVFAASVNHSTVERAEKLIELADQQLYKSKHSGKNRVCHYVVAQSTPSR